MRFLRAAALASSAIGVVAVACDEFEAGSTSVDAGKEAAANELDAASRFDGAIEEPAPLAPSDAGTGPFVLEVHGDPHFTSATPFTNPIGLGSSPFGWVWAGAVREATTIGPAIFGDKGAAYFSIGHDGHLLGSGLGGPVEDGVASAAIDSAGDIYLVGQRTISAAVGTAGFVRKISGTTGKTLWSWDTSLGLPDAGDAGIPAAAVTVNVATHLLNVAIVVVYRGAIAYPAAPSGAYTQLVSHDTANDSALFFLNGGNGKVLWGKQIGSVGTQTATTVEIADDDSVLVAGMASAGIPLAVDDVSVVDAGALNAYGPFVLHFDATEKHNLLLHRVVPVTPTSALVLPNAARLLANGDVVMCGLANNNDSFDGLPVTLRGGSDGWVARLSGTDGTTQWHQTFGGANNDDCTGLDVDSHDRIVVAVNHESSGVQFVGHPLADPAKAGASAAAIVKLEADGSWIWGYELAGDSARLARVAVAPNDDTLYAGYFFGGVDLGGGLIPPIDATPARPTAFVVRRGP